MTGDLYQILGVPSTADFAAIKRAYYRRAKECHPDRFQNSPAKTREFQILVGAFDTLSDGLKRRRYDISRLDEEEQLRTRQLRKQQPMMDSEADDILEELIVGNDAPPETSLATLLADLEKTEIFMKYREGRDHLDHRRNEAAEECFRFIVARAPQNIVFRVYLARAIARSDRYWPSVYHYKLALRFGARRRPQQLLLGVRKEMDQLRRRLRPVWSRVRDCFVGKPAEFIPDPADEMIAQLNRSLTRAARELPSSEERRRLK